MLYREIIAVNSQIHEKTHKCILLVETRIYYVKSGGTRSSQLSFRGLISITAEDDCSGSRFGPLTPWIQVAV